MSRKNYDEKSLAVAPRLRVSKNKAAVFMDLSHCEAIPVVQSENTLTAFIRKGDSAKKTSHSLSLFVPEGCDEFILTAVQDAEAKVMRGVKKRREAIADELGDKGAEFKQNAKKMFSHISTSPDAKWPGKYVQFDFWDDTGVHILFDEGVECDPNITLLGIKNNTPVKVIVDFKHARVGAAGTSLVIGILSVLISEKRSARSSAITKEEAHALYFPAAEPAAPVRKRLVSKRDEGGEDAQKRKQPRQQPPRNVFEESDVEDPDGRSGGTSSSSSSSSDACV